MTFRGVAKNGKLVLGPIIRERFIEWLSANDGKTVVISEDKPQVSNEMRGYVFGAVIPFLKRLVPAWEPLANEQVYEILKKNFNYFEAYNPLTKRNERYGQSVMAQDNEREVGAAFLQEVANWVAENYAQPMPDPEVYKRWKDSAPLKTDKTIV